jgi:hypothetical protein
MEDRFRRSQEDAMSSNRPRGHSSNIFINYRREDSAGHAGRLFDALNAHFAGRLFMDIDTLEPGVDFVEAIEQAVGSCEVLIVLIGREWLTLKNAAGQRRLDDPTDFVRLEVESALVRKIRVIPVLVQDAPMPRAEELPPSLARLARRNAIELSDARWAYDVDRLARTIRDILEETEPVAPEKAAPSPEPAAPPVAAKAKGSRAWTLSLAALALVAAAVVTAVLWVRPVPSGNGNPTPAQQAKLEGGTVAPASSVAIGSPAGPVSDPPTQREPIRDAPPSVAPVSEPSREAPSVKVPRDDEPIREPASVPSAFKPSRKAPPAQVPFDDEPAETSKSAVADPPQPEKTVSVVTVQPPRVTITSPAGGETVESTVQVQGTIAGLGEQRAFLCIRQKNGKIYPRGEVFPQPNGQWSIQLRSSKEKTFDILVVTTDSKEAAQALSDQKSRDDGLPVPPDGASISSGIVALKRLGKFRDLLRPG